MVIINTVKLVLDRVQRVLSACVDAVGDITGRSLPFKADDVAKPDTLARLLNEGALQPHTAPIVINTVVRQDIPSVSSNCHNLVLTIEAGRGRYVALELMFVKVPMEPLATRWFFSIINSWQLESYFFRHVAQTLPLRTPINICHRFPSAPAFYLVQENLHEDPTVELFINPDMMAGAVAGAGLRLPGYLRPIARLPLRS